MKKLTRIGAMLVMAALAAGIASGAESELSRRTITVTGTHSTTVEPDRAVWHLTITDENPNLIDAKRSNDAKLRELLATVKGLGVAPGDVQAGTLNVRKEYERDQQGNRRAFKHWSVSRSVRVVQQDLNRFDEFFQEQMAVGDCEVGFSLEADDIHTVRWDNRLKAVAIARKKAEEMLAELGATLGKPVKVDEHAPTPMSSGMYMSNNAFAMPAGGIGQEDQAAGTFAPGAIDVRTTVYVTFEIE